MAFSWVLSQIGMSGDFIVSSVWMGWCWRGRGTPKHSWRSSADVEQGCVVGILSRFQPDGAIPVPRGSWT